MRGRVTEIATDVLGDPYLSMEGVNYVEPTFFMKSGQTDAIGALRKGVEVTVSCVGAGDIMKMPVSKRCVLE